MMKEPSHRVSIAFFVTTLVLIMGLKAEAQTKTNTKTLTLGVVFQGPREPLEQHFRRSGSLCGTQARSDGGNQGNGCCRAHAGANDETA